MPWRAEKEIFHHRRLSSSFAQRMCYNKVKPKETKAELPSKKRGSEIMIRSTCNADMVLEKDALTVCLSGEIDHHSAVRIREEIDTQIYRYRPKKTVLDLSRIEFMDSSGLGLIMGRIALMRELGGSTVLKNPTEKVLRIVRLSGLERMMKIVREEEA